MQDVRGKVAVVTGAASGIGRALSSLFAAEGAAVVMADRDPDGLAGVAETIRRAGGDVEPVVTEITDPKSVDAFADKAFGRFGGVDILCVNVGIMGPRYAPIWETPLAEWHDVFGVNVFGGIHTINAFVPRMLAADREGHIVVTASMAALLSSAISITSAPYMASKHAVRTIAETLRRNLSDAGSKIDVSILCPGPTNTNMLKNWRVTNPTFDTQHAAAGGEGVLEPSRVAAMVLDAIRTKRFFIFTHPDSRGRVTPWLNSILAELPS